MKKLHNIPITRKESTRGFIISAISLIALWGYWYFLPTKYADASFVGIFDLFRFVGPPYLVIVYVLEQKKIRQNEFPPSKK